jgi:hypothetical protein
MPLVSDFCAAFNDITNDIMGDSKKDGIKIMDGYCSPCARRDSKSGWLIAMILQQRDSREGFCLAGSATLCKGAKGWQRKKNCSIHRVPARIGVDTKIIMVLARDVHSRMENPSSNPGDYLDYNDLGDKTAEGKKRNLLKHETLKNTIDNSK